MPAGRIRTQGLTEGAILAALVAIFAVATRYLPLVGMATALLCPLPLAVLVIRHGFRVAAIATVAATLVGTLLAGPLVGLAILVSFAPIGLVLGVGGRQRWPATRILLVGAAVAVLSTSVSYLGLLGGERLSVAEMTKTMERSMETSDAMTQRITAWMVSLGLPQDSIEARARESRELSRQLVSLLPLVLPALLIFAAIFASWLNYAVGRRVLERFGYHLNALSPMRTWRVPVAGVWLVPVSALLLALVGRLPVTLLDQPPVSAAGGSLVADILRGPYDVRVVPGPLYSAAWSLWFGAQMVFLLQGVLAGWMILGNFGFGRGAQALSVAMVLVMPVLSIVALYLGILDSVLKVRERWGLPRRAVPKPEP